MSPLHIPIKSRYELCTLRAFLWVVSVLMATTRIMQQHKRRKVKHEWQAPNSFKIIWCEWKDISFDKKAALFMHPPRNRVISIANIISVDQNCKDVRRKNHTKTLRRKVYK